LDYAQTREAVVVSNVLMACAWRRTGDQLHRLERCTLSDDSKFKEKAADFLGL
jgi:hypothetical protein